ncbi:hypothetical protein PoB_001493300 [Plakobranchus ocellatus]|uniref:Uncharacterized protein n=1 Tax=Plakobranchus ocellatus TaxID=259542 RepID=A0AAV3Z0Y2_9GAST|nr:hypothetical protein PoB_001493300 [Plakobranchus ocellatus]
MWRENEKQNESSPALVESQRRVQDSQSIILVNMDDRACTLLKRIRSPTSRIVENIRTVGTKHVQQLKHVRRRMMLPPPNTEQTSPRPGLFSTCPILFWHGPARWV